MYQDPGLTRKYNFILIISDILDISPEMSAEDDFVNWVSGNKVLDGSIPMAHRWVHEDRGSLNASFINNFLF